MKAYDRDDALTVTSIVFVRNNNNNSHLPLERAIIVVACLGRLDGHSMGDPEEWI